MTFAAAIWALTLAAEQSDRLDQFGLYLIGVGCFFWVLIILGSILWGWMLIDCALNESSEGNEKMIWLAIIFFLHMGGALAYFFYRRPRRKAELGR